MNIRSYGPLIDWSCHEFSSYPDLYFENSRQLFENPRRDGLNAALDRGCQYSLLSDDQVPKMWSKDLDEDNTPGITILSFINRYYGPRSEEEVIYCCTNRLEILIKKGLDLNEERVKFPEIYNYPVKNPLVIHYTTVNYAIQSGTWNTLVEIFLQIGWNEAKIQELYDQEILLGVSMLMEGLQYHTLENAREEFLQQLLDSVDFSSFDFKRLSMELATPQICFSDVIIRARPQQSKKSNIPGSWPEGEVAMESRSEKCLIIPWCSSFYYLTEMGLLCGTCIHDGQYHTKCHVPRKEWKLWYADMQLVDMVEDMESDEDSD